eukprot:5932662-Amphidinium_carterae.1
MPRTASGRGVAGGGVWGRSLNLQPMTTASGAGAVKSGFSGGVSACKLYMFATRLGVSGAPKVP